MLNSIRTTALYASIIATLFGCGGSDQSTNKPTNVVDPVEEVAALPVTLFSTSYAVVESKSYVNLNTVLQFDEQSDSTYISNIAVLQGDNENCAPEEIAENAKIFSVKSSRRGVCTYSYTLSDFEQTPVKQGVVNVSVQEEATASTASLDVNRELLPISEIVLIGSETEVDLNNYLNLDIPEGYTIETTPTVLGDAVSLISLQDGVLTVSGQEIGTARVIYSAYNEGLDRRLFGAVDFSVNKNVVTAPRASDLSISDKVVKVTKPLIIDLEEDGLVSDIDGDPWFITNVIATNASVQVAQNDSGLERSIKFTSLVTGTFYIVYTVADNHDLSIANTASATIQVTVESVYDDIELTESQQRMYAPRLSAELRSIDVDVYGDVIESDGLTSPVLTWPTADAYCKARGMSLPTPSLLHELYEQENENGLGNWPTTHPFWSSSLGADATSAVTVDLANNTEILKSIAIADGPVYTACVSTDLTPVDFYINGKDIENVDILINSTEQLVPFFVIKNGTVMTYIKSLLWQLADPENDAGIVEIDSETGLVTGIAPGKVTIVASNAQDNVSDTIEVTVIEPDPVALNYTIMGVGYNGSFGYNIAEPGRPSHSMLVSSANFGRDATSNTVVDQFYFVNAGNNHSEIIRQLESDTPPDLVSIGYAYSPNQDVVDALYRYLQQGGSVFVMLQDGGGAQRLARTIVSSNARCGTFSGGGAVYELTSQDDPILNGPFGDIRNTYWGEDISATAYCENLPASDVEVYSLAKDVSGSATRDGGVTAYRHKTLNFIWVGDGGFTSGVSDHNDHPDDHRIPFSYGQNFVPIPNTNYGRGRTKFSVYNSYFYANAIDYLLSQSSIN